MPCQQKCKMVQPLWKTLWQFLKKLKIESPYDPAIPLLGTHPNELKARSRRVTFTPMFTAALCTIAKKREQPKHPSADEQINRVWYEGNPVTCYWMNHGDITLSAIRQSQKDKFYMIPLV